jgi:hypothetical protein
MTTQKTVEKRIGDKNSESLILVNVNAKWMAKAGGLNKSGKMDFIFINGHDGEYGYADQKNGVHYAVICVGLNDGTREYLKWIEPNKYIICEEIEAFELSKKYNNNLGMIRE